MVNRRKDDLTRNLNRAIGNGSRKNLGIEKKTQYAHCTHSFGNISGA